MKEVVLVAGLRSPFSKAGTDFKAFHAADMGAQVLKELLLQTNLSADKIDEVIIGNVGNPSDAANISRVVALKAGLPQSVSAYTVHRNCASALESASTAFDKIRSGSADIIIAGGVENMSQYPLLFTQRFSNIFGEFAFAKSLMKKLKALKKLKLKDLAPRISVLEGLTDPFVGLSMGQTAEVLAKEFSITREEQDNFALKSHQNAVKATEKLSKEILPLFIPPKLNKVLEKDNGPRESQSIESLKKLRPYFDRKYGSVTVGNACPLTDGAAMLLLMSKEKAQELGLKPLAYVRSYAYAGCDPSRMGLGPVYATAKLLAKQNISLQDIDLVELNEAFAAQVLACQKAFASEEFCKKELGLKKPMGSIDPSKLNVNGGAIAIGHPVGATGSRLILTLAKEMQRQEARWGLATLCIGGGQGGSLLLEKIDF
ncbi:MAG: thiolase family protein [Bdellovibrionaceae bacterium]|nr:thiolase family protein [Pseudobdellovibrionaceae bacterium]